MPFHSILFDSPRSASDVTGDEPACFKDLNLDQVVQSITAGREEYDLAPFFYTPLRSVDAIAYRHEVLGDLRDEALRECVGSFAQSMRVMRAHLAQAGKLRHRLQQQRWFLDAARAYCEAVVALASDLAAVDAGSRGVVAFRDVLTEYAASAGFTAIADEAREVEERLSEVRYCLDISGNRIRVSRYEEESDYGAAVLATFERFEQGAVEDHRIKFPNHAEMDHVEAGVLERVAKLHPDVFSALEGFCDRHRDFLDATLNAFDREVQFYVAYLEFVQRLRTSGLSFCLPRVLDRSKEVLGRNAFDVALAGALAAQRSPVVCNDFHLEDPERVFVVSGPNQGGKTTFARMFGQLHWLAGIGCPVPGTEARLFLCDRLFTHFEREETLQDLSGKLQDDLLRVHRILERATSSSVAIMNEIFTSTTLSDAVFLGTKVLEEIIERDLLCVCVTFVDELASLDASVVSMVSTVDPEDPAVRTFKVLRRPADGLAHAVAIAEKYELTYERLKGRIAS